MTIKIEEKTELEITSELLSEMPDEYQKNVGYFIWDFCRALGIVLKDLWSELFKLCAFWNVESLDYDDLVRFVFQRRGIIAHTETYATGFLKVNGSCKINEGAIFETADGLQVKSLGYVELADGELFECECLTAGEVGNVPANTVTKNTVTIQGLISVTNPKPFSGGYEKETKESLIERYYDSLRKPITSGNIYHYEKWAKEVNGVGKVKVKPLWNGNNTVKVIVMDSNNDLADLNLIKTVQNYIDPYDFEDEDKKGWGCGNGQAPISAYCTVSTADKKEINISFKVRLEQGSTIEACTQSVKKDIESYLKTLIFVKDAYVGYAQIGALLIGNEHVRDYSDLMINNLTENINLIDSDTSCEVPILVNLNVDEQVEAKNE